MPRPSLSEAERAGFPALGFRKLLAVAFAHVSVIMTRFMDCYEVVVFPIVVISVYMV